MNYLLTTENLTKQFKKQKAVDNLCLHIPRGAIYALVGKNGAGKTTTMKMIAGLSHPTLGNITMFSQDMKGHGELIERIGVLIEQPGLYPGLTAAQNLKIKCLARGVLNPDEKVQELLNLTSLNHTEKKTVKHFSLGMKKRLGIALTMVEDPDLLLLDEPVSGLDPQGIMELRELFLQLNQEKNVTILISSHILDELSKLATHYGIMDQGVLLEELTAQELQERCRDAIRLQVDQTEKACTVLEQMGIADYKVTDSRTIEIYKHLEDPGAISLQMGQNSISVSHISLCHQTLEDYFLQLTGGNDHV